MVPVGESTVWEEMLSTRGDALFVEASTANRSQLVVNRSHLREVRHPSRQQDAAWRFGEGACETSLVAC
jgi:hypothetical protein